jgi:hypothetical protein
MNANSLSESFERIAVIVGALGLAVIGINAPDLLTQFHELRQSQHEQAIVGKVCEISRTSELVRLLADGRYEETRQILSSQLVNDVGDLRASISDETGPVANLGRLGCTRVVSMEKAHPEYFLSS